MFKTTTLALSILLSASVVLANHSPAGGREVPLPLPPQASKMGIQHSPDSACLGKECLVAWMASVSGGGTTEIRAARVTSEGRVLDTGFTVATPNQLNSSRPQVVAVKSGYVVFYGGGLYATVSSAGRVIDRDRTLSFSNRLVSVTEAVTAGGALLIFWEANRGPLIPYLTLTDLDLKEIKDVKVDGQPSDIAATPTGFVVGSYSVDGFKLTRLGADGSLLGESVIPLQLQQSYPSIAATDGSILVAWRRASTQTAPAAIEATVVIGGVARSTLLLERFVATGIASSLDVQSNSDGFLVSWSRPSGDYYTHNLYSQRFGVDGAPIDAQPVAVSPKPALQLHAKAVAIKGGYLLTWTDSRYGMGHDHVFGKLVRRTGRGDPDFLVSRSGASQANAVLAVANGIAGLAWNEFSATGSGAVMFARLLPDGSIIGAPMRLTESGGVPAIAGNDGRFIVAWRDTDSVRVITVSPDGVIAGAARIGATASGEVSVAASPAGVIVAWVESKTIMTARVGPDATILESPKTIGYGTEARVAFDGTQYWVVSRTSNTIEARRIGSDGAAIDSIPFTLASPDGQHDQVALACGDRTCVALWRSAAGEDSNIEGAMLTSGGVIPGIVAAHSAVATQPALAWNGTHYVLAWAARRRGETAFDIHYGELSSSGNLLGTANGQAAHRITESDLDERAPSIASLGHSRLFAFSRAAEEGDRIYLRFDGPQTRRRAARR